jgi:hypothetical protein
VHRADSAIVFIDALTFLDLIGDASGMVNPCWGAW